MRRYLEYTATILADTLRARIEFRGDGHYDLGDFVPLVLKEWRKKLEDGEQSAAHWNRDKEKKALSAKRAQAKELIVKTSAEQWAINPSIHFNEWANLQRHEFQEVVDAFKELLENLRCENPICKSYLYVQPRKGKAEEMRCSCGATNINLRTRDEERSEVRAEFAASRSFAETIRVLSDSGRKAFFFDWEQDESEVGTPIRRTGVGSPLPDGFEI